MGESNRIWLHLLVLSTISYSPELYFGTSAATPHVAGAAALLKFSRSDPFIMREIYMTRWYNPAVDMGVAGRDNIYGYGRLELSLLPVGTPVMNLSRTELNFGAVLLGASQTLNLGIVNTGQASLVITNILLPSSDYSLSPIFLCSSTGAQQTDFCHFFSAKCGR